jgi:YfiH family protein
MTQTAECHVTALQSDLLREFDFVRHGVTGRVPGLGLADGNVGFGSPRDKSDAWEMRQLFCASIGIDPYTLVTVGQVHGNDVRVVTADDAGKGATPGSTHLGLADALITDAENVALMTLHADCLMLFLVDPVRPAVGVVHAGWRGTVVDIAGETVARMRDEFGSDLAQIHAFLGPAISGAVNEVGPEVTAAWREQAADLGDVAESAVTKPGAKEHFDVPRANELLLIRAGLDPAHIEVSAICTKLQGDSWFSHRGQGPHTGRHGAIISLVRS